MKDKDLIETEDTPAVIAAERAWARVVMIHRGAFCAKLRDGSGYIVWPDECRPRGSEMAAIGRGETESDAWISAAENICQCSDGIVRSVGRDNEELVTKCSSCSSPNKNDVPTLAAGTGDGSAIGHPQLIVDAKSAAYACAMEINNLAREHEDILRDDTVAGIILRHYPEGPQVF